MLNLAQHKKATQLPKSEHNYKEAVAIVKDNPDVFDGDDITSLVHAWFGAGAIEILDKDADTLRCGVGTKPGAKCTKDECLMVELCVHKDRKPLLKDATAEPDTKTKQRDLVKKLTPSKELGIKVKI